MWSILDPLAMGLIYWFVFTTIFKRSVGEEPCIIFLLTASCPGSGFRSACPRGRGPSPRRKNSPSSTAVPREIWVLRPVFARGVEFLFYASPTIYGLGDIFGNDRMPRIIQDLYLLNPLGGILSAFRAGIFAQELHWPAIASSAIICTLTLVSGYAFFARSERAFLKEI